MAAKKVLTDRFLRSIKPAPAGKRDPYPDAQVPGLVLRVSENSAPHNVGVWIMSKRFGGRQRKFKLGTYPQMGLAEARVKAAEMLADMEAGIDPGERRKAAQRALEAARANTFAAALERYRTDVLLAVNDKTKVPEKRTGARMARDLEMHALPFFEDRPLSDIQRRDVIAFRDHLAKRFGAQANRTLTLLRTFFDWAVDANLIGASPALGVKRPVKELPRDRILSEDELRAVWMACEHLGAFGHAVRMMILTGQRRTEVGALPWREIDIAQRLWTIPRERTKANRAHVVPLSGPAMEVLEASPRFGPYVFTTNGETPVSGWAKGKERLDARALEILRADDPDADLPAWRLHDLRRTCSTLMGRYGVTEFIVARVLNHSNATVTGKHYNLYDYEREKRAALDTWAQRLRGIIEGRPANVIDFAEARG